MQSEDTSQLLDHVPQAVRRAVEERSRLFSAQKGRTVVSAGSASTNVFFLLEGEAQILLYSPNGREVSVRLIGPGEVFGEIAVLDGRPRSATVVVTREARILKISRSDFLLCVESSPGATMWLARRLGAEVRRLTERVFELSALNVQARLHCELLRLARIGRGTPTGAILEPAPTHAELANRIGTHREAVTREMRALVERNIVRAGRRSLEFLDLDQLAQFVNHAAGEHPELDRQ